MSLTASTISATADLAEIVEVVNAILLTVGEEPDFTVQDARSSWASHRGCIKVGKKGGNCGCQLEIISMYSKGCIVTE